MNFNRPPEEEERLKALRRERFRNAEGEGRYQKLVAERAARRQQLEAQGVLSKQGALAEAKKIAGTCTLMCPVFEREEREVKNNIAPQELVPGTRRADPARTVKTFHRSAAGNEEPLPEDLRTPETLLRTLDHLVGVVIAEDPTLQSCHGFVRDRTRSIRQDFTIQNIRDWSTVAACERIARFHIVSLHVLCGHKDFAEQQDMEQLRNTLKTLIELYDDHRRAGKRCANEAEFYAYYVVSHLRDSDAKRVAERLPAHIFTAPVVQQALRLHMLSDSSGTITTRRDPGCQFGAQNLATQFFRAVASPDTPPLLACLAEYRFPSIRRAALKAMCDAFPYQEGKEYPIEVFGAMLAFDSTDEVREFCQLFAVTCNDRGIKLGERVAGSLVYRESDQRPQRMRPNLRVVGSKFRMSPMQAIDGTLDARLLGSGSLDRPPAAWRMPAATALLPSMPAAAAVAAPATAGVTRPSMPPALPAGARAPPIRSPGAFASEHGGIFGNAPLQSVKKDSARVPVADMATGLGGSGSSTQAAAKEGGLAPTGGLFSFAPARPAAPGSAPTSLFQLPAIAPPSDAHAAPATVTPPASTPGYSFSVPGSGQGTAAIPVPAAAAPEPSPPPPPPPPEPPAVVWNRPRQRVNFVSLANALYDNLMESLVREVALPEAQRVGRWAGAAESLAGDIAQSIIDYTSAFVAYEEAYRCVIFAQADDFRRTALLRTAVSQWSMESVARQQDRARQKQQQDDLDDIIDSEYTNRLRAHYDDDDDDVFGTVYRPPGGPLGGLPAATISAPPVPEGFWESSFMGAECLESISRALVRFGSPAFQAAVSIAGTRSPAVLSSWLWWQIDPSSTGGEDAGPRTASYVRDSHALVFTEQPAEQSEAVVGATGLAARITILCPEPVSAADVSGGSNGDGLAGDIASRVDEALDWARARATHGVGVPTPVLFVFWSGEPRAGKAARRLIEKAIGASGVPSHVVTSILAMDLYASKQQLGAGLRWVCRHLVQARRGMLVKVSRAYGMVASTLQQQLHRMQSCVASVTRGRQIDDSARTAVFNMAVDVANAFVALINKELLASTSQRAEAYPHVAAQEGVSGRFFSARGQTHGASAAGAMPNAIVATLLDEILASESAGTGQQPALGACLRALEFAVKHQLDVIQQTVPDGAYADRHAVADATRSAVRLAEQSISWAARLCQTAVAPDIPEVDMAAFTTPTPKRTSALAFSGSLRGLPGSAGLAASPVPPTAMSISSTTSRSTAASKRRRPASARKIAKLQSAMERAGRQLLD